jgi:hypothetical protein
MSNETAERAKDLDRFLSKRGVPKAIRVDVVRSFAIEDSETERQREINDQAAARVRAQQVE